MTDTKRDDGGPAFPRVTDSRVDHDETVYDGPEGVSVRDYSAAQFMDRAQSLSETREGGWDFDNAAHCCYQMADAMLKARKA